LIFEKTFLHHLKKVSSLNRTSN